MRDGASSPSRTLAEADLVLQDVFRQLFSGVVIGVSAPAGRRFAELHPDEERAVGGAVAKRREQYTAGRACAREALSRLGIEGFPLLNGADRAPIWPEAVVGSISHCDGYCGAVVARRTDVAGLGFDVERATPLAADLRDLICSRRETLELREHALPVDPGKLVFSAKESFYKCYYPAMRRFLDFLDVEVRVRPEEQAFHARVVADGARAAGGPSELWGRFVVRDGFVFTGVTRP